MICTLILNTIRLFSAKSIPFKNFKDDIEQRLLEDHLHYSIYIYHSIQPKKKWIN
jgi:hypothetical protein